MESKVEVADRYKALIAGLEKNPPHQPLEILGDKLSLRQLIARLQERVDASDATKAKKSEYHQAVQAERVVKTATQPVYEAVKRMLQAIYGKENEKLSEFGIAVAKPPKRTAAAKAEAAKKGAATRKSNRPVPNSQPEAPANGPSTNGPSTNGQART
jgi:hypothetical protein